MQFDNWSLLLGILLSSSLLIGAILYALTKEEVDKYSNYLRWALIITVAVGFIILSYLTSWFYLAFLAIGLLSLIKQGKFNIQPYLVGAAIGFAVKLDIKLTASYFLAAYGILLASYLCKDLTKKNAIKFGVKLFINSLTGFLVVFIIPFLEGWRLPIFFVLLALSLPNQKIFK